VSFTEEDAAAFEAEAVEVPVNAREGATAANAYWWAPKEESGIDVSEAIPAPPPKEPGRWRGYKIVRLDGADLPYHGS
jgi:hypothetical protein